MKTAPLTPTAGSATSPMDPVVKKKPCPKFEAGFLHVESTDDFDGIHDAVKALTPAQSIFEDLVAPQAVLTAEACQYVNLPPHINELRDEIPGRGEIFRVDRMGNTPRILVRFSEKEKYKFKIELTPGASNLNYYDTEIPKNPKFEQKLSEPGKEYETNDSGYLIITDLTLSAAGGNLFTITVKATSPVFAGVDSITFTKGMIRTARYLWMLPVVGGKDNWNPTVPHSACTNGAIGMYGSDAFIHINSRRFKEQNIPEVEFIEKKEIVWDKHRALFQSFLDNAEDIHGNPYPPEMKNYILISLMTRFVYEKTKLRASGLINIDGGKHTIDIPDGVVEPIPTFGKPYLISAIGCCLDLTSFKAKIIRLENHTRAVYGYGNDYTLKTDGHIGCKKFEIDTAGLPEYGLMNVYIEFFGMESTSPVGSHWGDDLSNTQSGFYFFTGQSYNTSKKMIENISPYYASCISSHEIGHAVQMATNGSSTKPNEISSYYDNIGPDSFGNKNNETETNQGPHCRTGFIPISEETPTEPATEKGTCIMFGTVYAENNIFCSVTDPDKLIVMSRNKQNDCSMAVKKVDLNEAFSGLRV